MGVKKTVACTERTELEKGHRNKEDIKTQMLEYSEREKEIKSQKGSGT